MGKILRYNTVTTRKPHFCFGCGRKFQSPCKMISAAFTDCGSVSNYYLCMTCDSIVSKMEYDDEYCYGDLYDEAIEREKSSSDTQK